MPYLIVVYHQAYVGPMFYLRAFNGQYTDSLSRATKFETESEACEMNSIILAADDDILQTQVIRIEPLVPVNGEINTP